MLLLPRESVHSKARRLVQSGRVSWAGQVAVVVGDTATYIVQCIGDKLTCSCPWGSQHGEAKPCSHILAAALAVTKPSTSPPSKTPARPTTTAPNPRPRRRQSRNVTRTHGIFIRVTDTEQLRALRFAANPAARYFTENGADFAVCEEAVLNAALRLAEGGCSR